MPIDIHAHYVPPQLIDAIAAGGKDIGVRLVPSNCAPPALHFDYGFKVRPFFPRLIEPVAARRGWLDPVPDRIRRRCGFAALGGIVAFALVAAAMAATGVHGHVLFKTGIHWAPLAMAAIEGPLAVGTCVWLLGVAQRRLDRPPGPLGRALARSAYGAFLLQGVVLIGLMIAMRPIDVPAEAKALTVAALGVAGSFALAWILITRTRLARII
jgi:hypothetical protein